MFGLTELEDREVHDWADNHECRLRNIVTTIGGKYTYCFTPTGVGVITVVKCACGSEIDITNYGDW